MCVGRGGTHLVWIWCRNGDAAAAQRKGVGHLRESSIPVNERQRERHDQGKKQNTRTVTIHKRSTRKSMCPRWLFLKHLLARPQTRPRSRPTAGPSIRGCGGKGGGTHKPVRTDQSQWPEGTRLNQKKIGACSHVGCLGRVFRKKGKECKGK